jgi:hypothetical protein
MTTATAPPASPPRPLTFDERLTLAALAIDARITTQPLDLDDTIRTPIDTPRPAPSPYSTPIAALLHQARLRIEADGWSREALVEEDGRRCAIGAIRREASNRGQADDACVLLLEAIQRHWHAETIPSWNAAQTSPAPVLLAFEQAVHLAHTRNL